MYDPEDQTPTVTANYPGRVDADRRQHVNRQHDALRPCCAASSVIRTRHPQRIAGHDHRHHHRRPTLHRGRRHRRRRHNPDAPADLVDMASTPPLPLRRDKHTRPPYLRRTAPSPPPTNASSCARTMAAASCDMPGYLCSESTTSREWAEGRPHRHRRPPQLRLRPTPPTAQTRRLDRPETARTKAPQWHPPPSAARRRQQLPPPQTDVAVGRAIHARRIDAGTLRGAP